MKLKFRADRPDLPLWFGRLGPKGVQMRLSQVEAVRDEKRYAVALLPWDAGDLATAKTLKLPVPAEPEVYAVSWLGKRLYRDIYPGSKVPHTHRRAGSRKRPE